MFILYLVHKTFVLFKLNAADYKHYLNIGVNLTYNSENSYKKNTISFLPVTTGFLVTYL